MGKYSKIMSSALGDIEQQPMVFDPEHPMSIHNLVPKWLSDKIKKLDVSFFQYDEKTLRKKCMPGLTHDALRISFWAEYSAAMISGRPKLEINRIVGGICTFKYLEIVTDIPGYLAYMLTPPKKYANSLQALLEISTSRMHEIVNMDITDKDGRVDSKLASLVMKAHEALANRLQGLPVQRIITAQANLTGGMMEDDLKRKEEYFDQRLIQLRSRAKKLIPEDVEITESEVVQSASGDELRLGDSESSD